MSKCRACGNESQLDDAHRAGTQLMKNLPKDMSEIESKKTGGATGGAEEKKAEEAKDGGKAPKENGEASGDDDKKEKKKKKKKDAAEEEEDQPVDEEGIKLDSEEVGKLKRQNIKLIK